MKLDFPIQEAQLSNKIFDDTQEYLKTINNGIPGSVVKWAVNTFPDQRPVIIDALGTTSGNLSRLYTRKALDKHQSEEVLDILRLVNKAANVFGDLELASEWLATPINALNGEKPSKLMDTFIGRQLVSNALDAIHYGEFT